MEISVARLSEILVEEINRAQSIGIELNPIKPEIQIENRVGCYGSNNGVVRLALVYISKYYLHAPEEELRTVICHEVCHSVKGSRGHDGLWREAVRKMRRAYDYLNSDYHLNPHPYSRNRGAFPHTALSYPKKASKTYRYEIKCDKCGATFQYSRMCRVVALSSKYTHNKCGGHFTAKSLVPGVQLLSAKNCG